MEESIREKDLEGTGIGADNGAYGEESPDDASILDISRKDELGGLSLAYIGDAVFELMVRLYMTEHGSIRVEKLHKRVTETVNAGTQSRISYILKDRLTDEEAEVFRRGRNQKSQTAARHQSITDYRRATGLEALFGWLYIHDRRARLRELFMIAMEGLEKGEGLPPEREASSEVLTEILQDNDD